MDRAMWQDHLVSVSKLFVERTKLFMLKNSMKADGNSGMCKSATSPRIKNLDNCDSDTEGEKLVILYFYFVILFLILLL